MARACNGSSNWVQARGPPGERHFRRGAYVSVTHSQNQNYTIRRQPFRYPTSAPTAYLRGFLKFESSPIQSANALKPQRRRDAEGVVRLGDGLL